MHVLTKIFIVLVSLLAILLVPLVVVYAHNESQDYDPKKAFHWVKKAADNGFWRAYYYVADSYEQGFGTKKDDVKAVEYYRLSAAHGHEPAILALQKRGIPAPPITRAGEEESNRESMLIADNWGDL